MADSITSFLDEIRNEASKRVGLLEDDLNAALKTRASTVKPKAMKELRELETNYIKTNFEQIVTDFYSDYTPKKYSRKGDKASKTGGLYDLFHKLPLTEDEHGEIATNSPETIIDESKMHPYRSGKGSDSLYDLVFVGGYHGGAKKIDSIKSKRWGKHPQTGTPYWRTYGWVNYGKGVVKRHRYGRWCTIPAEQTTPSPYERIQQLLDDINVYGVLDDQRIEIVKKYVDKMYDEWLKNDLPGLFKKHGFGIA